MKIQPTLFLAIFGSLVWLSSCVTAVGEHCLHKGDHAYCAANEPDHPLCSPCEEVGEHQGCVAEEPTEDECPAFEPPPADTETGADTDTDTGADTDTSGTTG